jgi:hypothetical protein
VSKGATAKRGTRGFIGAPDQLANQCAGLGMILIAAALPGLDEVVQRHGRTHTGPPVIDGTNAPSRGPISEAPVLVHFIRIAIFRTLH